ncbi:LexA family transcriptional regulator [Vibrio fluvialis]|nr:LexA family transcriptional regulator [Vibrio fluvialis]
MNNFVIRHKLKAKGKDMTTPAHVVFRQIRKSKKLKQDSFPNIASQATIGRFEQGRGDLKTEVLTKLLDSMGVTWGEFIARCEAADENDYQIKIIPVRSWQAITEVNPDAESVVYDRGASSRAFALKVRDASMIGDRVAFPIGSHIVVEPTERANEDDLVIIERAGSFFFRRYTRDAYIPENREFETLKGSDVRVIGRVVGGVWIY